MQLMNRRRLRRRCMITGVRIEVVYMQKSTRERLREKVAALAATHPIQFPTINSATPVIDLEAPQQQHKRQSRLDSWFNARIAQRKHNDDEYRTVQIG